MRMRRAICFCCRASFLHSAPLMVHCTDEIFFWSHWDFKIRQHVMTSKDFTASLALVLLAFLNVVCAAPSLCAFAPIPTDKFLHSASASGRKCELRSLSSNSRKSTAVRMGPPQKIEYAAGRVLLQREVARASYLLRIQSDALEEYQPGHVLALAIQDPKNPEGELVHPYTVTRSDKSSKTFDVLYRYSTALLLLYARERNASARQVNPDGKNDSISHFPQARHRRSLWRALPRPHS